MQGSGTEKQESHRTKTHRTPGKRNEKEQLAFSETRDDALGIIKMSPLQAGVVHQWWSDYLPRMASTGTPSPASTGTPSSAGRKKKEFSQRHQTFTGKV